MTCRIAELRRKEVISVKDGTRIGAVCDAEMDIESARLTSIVVYGRPKLFGLLGREEDIVIRWPDIQVVGEDTILVNYQERVRVRRKRGLLSILFGDE
ncbi:MAG TPA: YlmC/YmxH family sporulation protein [Candidatus Caccousia avicola]|uniref:YlmC/YmxH family sporulation protein n=1 Tax=Candidatus Caccousia avicola TaxID=2840721 RepID=A0A9D1API6_9FIRM|nr:YlmC/YmxH family sporulation protein [Candidatus Caccousia avicola]